MKIKTCLTEKEILNQNGRVIKNSDGTISVYTINSSTGQLSPNQLTKPCCEALGIYGAYFDTTTQKCRWSKSISCVDNIPFNLVLNPKGNDGSIFVVESDETCTLSVDFDYLFKFSCTTLTDLANGKIIGSCDTVIDVFENIEASMIIDVVKITGISTTLENVYEEVFFNKIGRGGLYNYLKDNNTDTGFFICGGSAYTDTTCNTLNLYDLNASGDTTNCSIPINQLLQSLFNESELDITGTTDFNANINANAFGPNWQHFHTDITDQSVIDLIANQKIKLTIRLSGVCIDMCVLVDNIELNKNCTKVDRNDIFVSQSPGFTLDKIIDNKKSWVANTEYENRTFFIGKSDGTQQIRNTNYFLDDERQVLNTKEIDLDINIASAVETDVWCYIFDNPCILTGTSINTTSCVKAVYDELLLTCTTKTYCCSEYCGDAQIDINSLLTQPLSSVTTIEDFKYYLSSELIDAKNRKIISSYPTLRTLYDRYLNSLEYCETNSSKFDYVTMDKFANLIGNYWVDLIEQVIPATTIWGSTKIYTNTIFDTEKYKYKPYTLFFGNNTLSNTKVLSPATGTTCNANVIAEVIQGSATGTTFLFNYGDKREYNSAYVIQMNSSSEFIGNVNILGPNGNGDVLNECSIRVSITATQPTAGNSDGTATANVVGSNGPVLYLWSNGETTRTITGLGAGTYSVMVSDSTIPSCTARASVIMVQNNCLITASATSTSSTGNTANGTATVTASDGFIPYTYSWNTTPVQTTQTATGLTAGTYTVIVTDISGCTANASTTVSNVPCNLSILISTTATTGNDGAATVDVISGFAPYTYSWNTTPVQTTQTITGLTAGTYTVTVTDYYGCTEIGYAAISDTGCTLTAITSTISSTGNTANGSATVTASGGTVPYTYSWNTTPVQTGSTATGLTASTYYVTVTDISGCTIIKPATVSKVPCILSGNLTLVSSTGNTNNGSVTVNITTGFTPYSYSWNTTPVQTGSTISGLSAGTYVVNVTDAYACTLSLTGIVTNVPCILTGITSSTSSTGNTANGTATISITTGYTPYSYSWNTTPVQTGSTATGLTASTYTVNVTDYYGCTLTKNVIVGNIPCNLTGNIIIVNSSGGTANGTATANIITGFAPYTYSWNTTPVQTGSTATGLTAGTYVVNVTDAYACTLSLTGIVSDISCTLGIASTGSTSSTGNTANGTATVTASGGTVPYTYSWNTIPPQTGSTATGLTAGTYTVIVTDISGCTANTNVTVGNIPCTLSASVITTNTTGTTANGTATVTPSSGYTPYTYSWNTTPVQTGSTATGLTGGTYIVTVTDAYACTFIASGTVISCNVSGAVITTNATYIGANDGTATVTPSGGTAPYTYGWNTTPVQTGSTATGLTAGTYTVNVTDTYGCVGQVSGTVTENSIYPYELLFDWNGATDEEVTAIKVNGITPTLIGGYDVPFNTDIHTYSTTQTGFSQTLTISITATLSGQKITVTDSSLNVQCQTVNASGDYVFTVDINNVNPVMILGEDGVC